MLIGLLISFILIAVFIAGIWRNEFFRIKGIPRNFMLAALFAKIIAGLFFWWIYTHYYTDRSSADIYKYFDDAQALMLHSEGEHFLRLQLFLPESERSPAFQELLENTLHWDRGTGKLMNDNRSIIRIHFLILFISNGFFHLHNLVFSLMSFLGAMTLLHFFMGFSKLPRRFLFCFLFFLPSILLFSSAALKESWLFFCLGYFLYYLGKGLKEKRLKHWLISAFFGVLLLGVKTYVLMALFPGLLFFLISCYYPKKIVPVFLGIHASIFLGLILFVPQFSRVLSERQAEFILLAEKTNARSSFKIQEFNGNLDLLLSLPNAVYNVWIRPIFSIFDNPFALLAALENAFLILAVLLCLFYFKKPSKESVPILLFSLSFLFILSCLIGFCVPIVGAIVRYKVPLYPFYFVALLSLIDFNKVPLLKRINQENP